MDSHSLFPIIVPRRYRSHSNWPGPIVNLRHPDLCVTWVLLSESGGMSYLSNSAAEKFALSGVDYAQESMENLRKASAMQLWTHEKKKGKRLIFCASMHEDGLGTSRLLLIDEWKGKFPGGFRLGIPERSCGVVVPNSTKGAELLDAENVIEGCFSNGNTKMLPGLHDPTHFCLENDRVDG